MKPEPTRVDEIFAAWSMQALRTCEILLKHTVGLRNDINRLQVTLEGMREVYSKRMGEREAKKPKKAKKRK